MSNTDKPKLLILTDMWGLGKANWLEHYKVLLNPHFDITILDICALGWVDSTQDNQEVIHQQFINGGIIKAVRRICDMNEPYEAVLGFSMGGTIAWKALLKGLKTNHFFAASSTRLRYESKVPAAKTRLYFSEDDFEAYSFQFEEYVYMCIVMAKEHEYYRHQFWAEDLCDDIITEVIKN